MGLTPPISVQGLGSGVFGFPAAVTSPPALGQSWVSCASSWLALREARGLGSHLGDGKGVVEIAQGVELPLLTLHRCFRALGLGLHLFGLWIHFSFMP